MTGRLFVSDDIQLADIYDVEYLENLHSTPKMIILFLYIYYSAKEELPMTQAGCLSQMTFSWQTSMMWNIYRKGIDCIAHMGIGDREKAKPNADR